MIFIKELSEAIQPGHSALFVLVNEVTSDKVLERLEGYRGTVLKTSLSKEEESELEAILKAA